MTRMHNGSSNNELVRRQSLAVSLCHKCKSCSRQAWLEQTDTTLQAAAAAEDIDEVAIRMGKNEDDPDYEDSETDSDCNSMDAE
jgi:hypothetical protein